MRVLHCTFVVGQEDYEARDHSFLAGHFNLGGMVNPALVAIAACRIYSAELFTRFELLPLEKKLPGSRRLKYGPKYSLSTEG